MSYSAWVIGLAFVLLVIALVEWLSRDEEPLGWARPLERWKDKRSRRSQPDADG
ncbi:hypothetical protein [Salinarimonas soli]|uniref:hypothetical protein n=1 Tax=Salinarimonas soli TaxID=1638099 RepID=UPI0016620842|nr:hypothetical protein [Salinarimonas soli]